jgi:uncharacterized membrane protein YhfC
METYSRDYPSSGFAVRKNGTQESGTMFSRNCREHGQKPYGAETGTGKRVRRCGMLAVSLISGIAICYVLPVVGTVLLARRRKGIGKAFFCGMLAFAVSQLLIRVPLLQLVLPEFSWYTVLPLYPWRYGLFLGLTAGLAEESARWIAVKCFLKGKDSFGHGLAFGLGHGGIEAMLLVGPNMIAGLGVVLGEGAAMFPASAADVMTAGTERLIAMLFHTGASLIVLYGVRKGRVLWYWAAAVALHTAADAAVVILPKVFGAGTLGIELWAAVAAGITFALGCWLFCNRRENVERGYLTESSGKRTERSK